MGNASGVSRGDRNRTARLARLRELVPTENAIVGIDLADRKQMVVVCDHDSKVLTRRTLEEIRAEVARIYRSYLPARLAGMSRDEQEAMFEAIVKTVLDEADQLAPEMRTAAIREETARLGQPPDYLTTVAIGRPRSDLVGLSPIGWQRSSSGACSQRLTIPRTSRESPIALLNERFPLVPVFATDLFTAGRPPGLGGRSYEAIRCRRRRGRPGDLI